jgi:hypothetical protein
MQCDFHCITWFDQLKRGRDSKIQTCQNIVTCPLPAFNTVIFLREHGTVKRIECQQTFPHLYQLTYSLM